MYTLQTTALAFVTNSFILGELNAKILVSILLLSVTEAADICTRIQTALSHRYKQAAAWLKQIQSR